MDPDAAAFASCLRPGLLAVAHVNADPDALGSAYALARMFDGIVAAPGGVSAGARRLQDALGLALHEGAPERALQVVCVDASSAAQFRPWTDRLGAYLLVDHHAPGDLAAGAAAAHVRERTSCAEVVLDVLDAAGRPPDREAAFALLVALVSDTGRFRFADARTFRAAARLLDDSGRTLDDVAIVLGADEEDDAVSGRMAALRAAQRADVTKVGDRLVATSLVGSHEARAALGLVRAGADVAFVASEASEGTRVSGRASREAAAKVHLGELMRAVAKAHGVSGGGHAASAGLNGNVKPALVLPALVRAVEEAFR